MVNPLAALIAFFTGAAQPQVPSPYPTYGDDRLTYRPVDPVYPVYGDDRQSYRPVAAGPAPTPEVDPLAGVLDFYRSQMPPSQQGRVPLEDYYPIGKYLPDLVKKGESQRKGLGVLAALTGFHESTGGRLNPNVFGVLPGGEGAGQGGKIAAIDIPGQINYLFGPEVYGGGATANMNILKTKAPLSEADVANLYQSFDPHGAYLQDILKSYSKITKGF